jgi:hypothetical protein
MWPFKEKPTCWWPDSGDFIVDDLGDYIDLHQETVIHQIKSIMPLHFFNQAFICGGFAANVVGITNSYDDVDIFVTDRTEFMLTVDYLQRHHDICVMYHTNSKDDYGERFKFIYKTSVIDLVDYSKVIDKRRQAEIRLGKFDSVYIKILKTFDINWSMACIDVGANVEQWHKVIYHEDALSPTVAMNEGRRITNNYHIAERINKYQSRLSFAPNLKWNDAIAKKLMSDEKGSPSIY